MKLNHVLDPIPFANAGINSVYDAATNGELDIVLRQFDDSNISPEMAELLNTLSDAESFFEVRAILNFYMPELNDGTAVPVE